jgi:hypothetical protein
MRKVECFHCLSFVKFKKLLQRNRSSDKIQNKDRLE